MVYVAVGSGNPVKVDATERVVSRVAGGQAPGFSDGPVTVAAVPVDSGVSEQPRGETETLTGAQNRARRALTAAGETDGDGRADFGVGIEGGVADLDGTGGSWLVMWAAVSDGDRLERGRGPAVRLPEAVGAEVRAGAELGPLLDDLLGTDGIKHDAGAAGVFTGGAIDRESALAHAVAGAFGPFVTEHY